MNLEEKQTVLRHYDPDKYERLTEMFMEYVAGCQHAPISRKEREADIDEAQAIYERAIDEAIDEEKQAFYAVWDAKDEAEREMLYRYMKDTPLRWLNEREETA